MASAPVLALCRAVSGLVALLTSEAQIETDGFFRAHQLTRMESPSSAPQSRLVDCVQVGRVDVADVVTRETGITIQGDVGLRRPFSSGNDGDCHRAETRDQHIDRQHNDRMLPCPRQPGIPDIAPERVHRLVDVADSHSVWQRSRLTSIELIVSCCQVHLLGTPVHKSQAFPD
jgi:hypothetical protein